MSEMNEMSSKSRLDSRRRAALWALWCVRGVRFRHFQQIEREIGDDVDEWWQWGRELLEERLQACGLKKSMASRVAERSESLEAPRRQLARELEELPEGVELLHLSDPGYPERFLELEDPPVFLYVDGTVEACHRKDTISVVGSRDARPVDVRLATRIVRELASRGITVVSGGALGIDRAAHEAALEAGGETVTLLPGGLDRPTPASNRDVFERVRHEGALATEYPKGVEVKPYHFPRRNRLIAALGDVTFVVRAGLKSGTMLTADAAMELGRPICALPGGLDEPLAEGSLKLLFEGAQLVRGAEDILETYFPSRADTDTAESTTGRRSISSGESRDRGGDGSPTCILPSSLSSDARELAEALCGDEGGASTPLHLDALSDRTNWSVGRLQTALLELELHGVCEKVGGAQAYRFRLG